MFEANQILYIVSALAASLKAMRYANNYNSPVEFFEADDQVHFNATLTLLIAIGEEVKKVEDEILQSQPNIPWQKVADMRNILAHDYRGVDLDIVFGVVKVELPKLCEAFIAFLHLFPQQEVEAVLQNQYYKHLQKVIY